MMSPILPAPLIAALLVTAPLPALGAHACVETDATAYETTARNAARERQFADLAACFEAGADACAGIPGIALERVWGHEDFRTADGAAFLTISEISRIDDVRLADFGWEKLGSAADQNALVDAEARAASGAAVIAMRPGHMVYILAGGLSPSGSWGVEVPLAAQLNPNSPERAFVGCKLSRAFRAADAPGVTLYARRSIRSNTP